MTTTARATRLTPTPADVAKYREQLRAHDHSYAYATGILGVIVDMLAANHTACGQPNCDTCRLLRSGLAVNAVLDEQTQQLLGGAR